MTTPQMLAFLIIAGMMVAFILGRWRYDLVAICALLAAMLVGIVPAERAFAGFANDIVIIVGSALVVSAAVARSGIMETAIRRYLPGLSSPRMQLIVLVSIVTVLSAFVKNIGALAIMMPIAFQMARKSSVSPSMFLMPMAFGSLLGVFLLGLVTGRSVKDWANVVAMVVMALINLVLLVLSETGVLAFAWSWLVILGTAGTIALALALSPAAHR